MPPIAMALEPIFLAGPSGIVAPIPGAPVDASRPTLFCDRDGTIIGNRDDYVREAAHTVPLPGATDALRRAADAGFGIVIVSNQSPIGRGLLERDLVIEVHRTLLARLERAGVPVQGTFLCPHHPDQGCPCRKPRAGMLRAALDGLPVDHRRSTMIGDAIEDIKAARAVGLTGLLVGTGRGAAHADLVEADARLRATPVVANLGTAVDLACRRLLTETAYREIACAE
jgi:D-glycero-D-manno-heptose 1,7-bisphosphate phosphatase